MKSKIEQFAEANNACVEIEIADGKAFVCVYSKKHKGMRFFKSTSLDNAISQAISHFRNLQENWHEPINNKGIRNDNDKHHSF